MKQYKLIKEYPGYKINTTVKNVNDHETDYYSQNPEFWQEVVKYPIKTRVYDSQTNSFYTREQDGWYNLPEKTSYTDDIITRRSYINIIKEKDYEILVWCNPNSSVMTSTIQVSSSWIIKSVRRLNDGEIFTIGDKIQLCKNGKEYGQITELYISHEQLRFYCGKLGGVLCHDIDKRNNFTKLIVKQKLFITEDGVDVFENNRYYYINNQNYLLHNTTSIKEVYEKNVKRFSTKEKAEEYIINNKPCLSIKEVLDNTTLKGKTLIVLEKLVKSRL